MHEHTSMLVCSCMTKLMNDKGGIVMLDEDVGNNALITPSCLRKGRCVCNKSPCNGVLVDAMDCPLVFLF